MCETLEIGFNQSLLARDLAQEIATPGVRPIEALEQLLSQRLTHGLKKALGNRFIKEPIARVLPYYVKNAWAVLSDLEVGGYETWYTELKFSTRPEDCFKSVDVKPSGFLLDPIDYGSGILRYHDFKVKPLKTQTNHVLRLNHLKLSGELFLLVRRLVESEFPLTQPYLANPAPYFRERGNNSARKELVAFDHITDGKRLYCSCAKAAHDQIRAEAQKEAPQFVADSWPHKYIKMLSNPIYEDGLCHLCIAQSSGSEAAAYRYGDNMQVFVEPYTNQLVRSGTLDERTARAEVQQQLGLSRWLREAEMYQIIKKIFPETLVFREASPPWLGRQRLDVYLPQLKLALEYQGQQHYQAVSLFGGADSLARTIERDALKKQLCEENSTELIYVRFDDPLTVASLKHKLRRFLGN